LPTQVKLTAAQTRDLFAAMKLDKKVRGGKIQFVLAKEIGRVVIGQTVPDKVIRQSLLD
jgi:3-dehydroquinate synthetase